LHKIKAAPEGTAFIILDCLQCLDRACRSTQAALVASGDQADACRGFATAVRLRRRYEFGSDQLSRHGLSGFQKRGNQAARVVAR
jgi:hypothetical protein